MATENEVREAYEKGVEEGVTAERERFRTFTGLPYIVMPKTDLPEHLAYPEYELRLQDVVAATEREAERLDARRERLIDAHVKAAQAYDEAVDEHRQEREGLGVFGKLKSVVTEPFLQEKTLAKNAEDQLAENWQAINENNAKLDVVRSEYAAVSAWVDEMYRTTMEAGPSVVEFSAREHTPALRVRSEEQHFGSSAGLLALECQCGLTFPGLPTAHPTFGLPGKPPESG